MPLPFVYCYYYYSYGKKLGRESLNLPMSSPRSFFKNLLYIDECTQGSLDPCIHNLERTNLECRTKQEPMGWKLGSDTLFTTLSMLGFQTLFFTSHWDTFFPFVFDCSLFFSIYIYCLYCLFLERTFKSSMVRLSPRAVSLFGRRDIAKTGTRFRTCDT